MITNENIERELVFPEVHKRKMERLSRYKLLMCIISAILTCTSIAEIIFCSFPHKLLFLVPALVLSILVLFFSFKFEFNKWKNFEKIIADTLEIRIVIILIVAAFLLILIFIDCKMLYPPEECQDDFVNAKIEWLVCLSFLLGLVGALWAVLAKLKADDAFTASWEAFEQSKKTLLSFGGSVNFDEIMLNESESDRMLPSLIKNAKTELYILVSIPLVGFFRNPQMGIEFISLLNNKLEDLRKSDYKDFKKLIILYFKDEVSKEKYLDPWIELKTKNINASNLSDKEKDIEKRKIEKLGSSFNHEMERLRYNVQEIMKDVRDVDFSAKHEELQIKVENYSTEIGIRFAISSNKNNKGIVTQQQALFWVVTDFDPDTPATVQDFESAGFSTKDPMIINVFKKLAEDYLELLPKIS